MNIPVECILKAAIAGGVFSDEQPLAGFVDTAAVKETIRRLRQAFPAHFEHAFAAKANTMRPALQLVREAGMGCEAASPGELEQALAAGFEPAKIVYDEPAKTVAVLRRLLQAGMALNIDNFQELERVSDLIGSGGTASRVGIRVNPQVGAGSIGPMSTATVSSKFGVTLGDPGNRERLVDCFLRHDWLTVLHAHVGSQGCPLELMAEGVRRLVDLAEEIENAAGAQRVALIDIGGGLPVNFSGDEVRPSWSDYAAELQRQAPELFSGKYRVQTEFGRSIFAKSGFMATRVEYTKDAGGRRIAVTHAGAQVAARTVFMPDHWKIRLSVCDATGAPKSGRDVLQDIAGPCCFAGDMIGTERLLPPIDPGDYVVLHDTGAYYFSIPFYYNALQAPAVFGAARSKDGVVRLECWREQQGMKDMLAMLG
ncbi:MAG: diaminopimelate decarboxylase [Lysobacterales bacterium]|jgi:diaminopimelate decarboxylase